MAPLVIRQYDVCRNKDSGSRARIPYFVVLQSDILSGLGTVIVAPLVLLKSAPPISRLNPLIDLQGKRYSVTMQDMAGIPRSRLGTATLNVASQHSEFIAAIDLMFSGF